MPTPTPSNVAPNIGNYFIGRGFAQVQLEGESSYSDLGNITVFEFQVKPTMLAHYSSRVGVRKKDFTAVTELEATLTLSMEEITARNMAMCVLGNVSGGSHNWSIDILSHPQFYAAFRFTGTNSLGAQWMADFPVVLLTPQRAISLISAGSGAWGTIDLQADVLFDSHSNRFGTLTNTNMA